MKLSLLLTVLLFLGSHLSFSQCISVKGLRSLFFKDMAAQDAYMAAKGYKVQEKFRGRGTIWANKAYETAGVSLNEDGKVIIVSYDPPTQPCFAAIKSEVVAMGMKKDKVISGENFSYTYFSNSSFGVEIYKFSGPTEDTYHVTLLSKTEYVEQMDLVARKRQQE
jgi:hypothetical protein